MGQLLTSPRAEHNPPNTHTNTHTHSPSGSKWNPREPLVSWVRKVGCQASPPECGTYTGHVPCLLPPFLPYFEREGKAERNEPAELQLTGTRTSCCHCPSTCLPLSLTAHQSLLTSNSSVREGAGHAQDKGKRLRSNIETRTQGGA